MKTYIKYGTKEKEGEGAGEGERGRKNATYIHMDTYLLLIYLRSVLHVASYINTSTRKSRAPPAAATNGNK